MHRPLLLSLAATLVVAAPAAAQDPAPVPTTPPVATPAPVVPAPTPKPKPPAPAPAEARLSVRVVAPHRADGDKVAVKGETVRIQGRMRPAVQGERAVVQVKRGGRKTVERKRVRFDAAGRFATKLRVKKLGSMRVRVIHRGSKAVTAARSDRTSFRALAPRLSYGADGVLATLFTRSLARMKYAVNGGSAYDSRVARAVMAYRKVNGLPRAESTTPQLVRDVLAGKGGYKVRFPKLGKHVEADLSRQILALVDGKRLVRVYHTSSGAPATPTILGTFSFYMKTIGTNAKGMVDSSYFIRGYAIHGYVSVPAFNASHGCLRVPIPDARTIYNWIDLGDRIRVTV